MYENQQITMGGGNVSLYALKLFCAIGVVLLHAVSISYENVIFMPLLIVAVPIFLLISGYYLVDNGQISLRKVNKQIKKIIRIILIYNFIFLLISSVINYGIYGNIIKSEWTTISFWVKWLFFGDNICYPYWYLTAYLEALLLIKLFHNKRFIYYLIPFLMLTAVALNRYMFLFTDVEIDKRWSVNALFCAVPCVLVGSLVKRKESEVLEIHFNKILVITVLLGGVAYIEYFVLNYFDIGQFGGNYYLMTFPLSIAIFIFALSFERYRMTNQIHIYLSKLLGFFAYLGKNHATNIYLFHVWIMVVLEFLQRQGFYTKPLQYVECVVLLTIIFSSCINYIKVSIR